MPVDTKKCTSSLSLFRSPSSGPPSPLTSPHLPHSCILAFKYTVDSVSNPFTCLFRPLQLPHPEEVRNQSAVPRQETEEEVWEDDESAPRDKKSWVKRYLSGDKGKQVTHYAYSLVRWGSYWLPEKGSDDYVIEAEKETKNLEENVTFVYNHYMTFVQTVGSPGLDYSRGERVEVRDETGQWEEAIISGVENNYYFIKHDQKVATSQQATAKPSEWIHKFSTRLRKLNRLDGHTQIHEAWDTFFELDWIQARHPTYNTYMAAKIVLKDEEEQRIVIQYEEPDLLIQQEALLREDLEGDPEKIKSYSNWEERWRFNRLHVYEGALRTVGLKVHFMEAENGHSLFRALSHQLFGTPNNYLFLRLRTLEHISRHKDYYQNFVDINFEYYIAHKKKGVEGEYFSMGDHLDIQAVCELYDAQVEIYSELSARPLETIRFYEQMKELPCIRLSYAGANHYDSVEDVNRPLPLTIVKNLRPTALGNQLSESKIILRARMALQQRVEAHMCATDSEVRSEVIFSTVRGAVEFDKRKDIVDILGNLLRELDLGDIKDYMPADDINRRRSLVLDPRKTKVYQSASNPDVVLYYPDAGANLRGIGMRIEGVKDLVDRAVEFVEDHATYSTLREYVVGSHVDYALGKRNGGR